jgi:glucose-6-phosphate 1-dehydrogenase
MKGGHRLRAGGGRAPGAIVVFGSSGNLATKRIIPAMESEMKAGRLGYVRAIGIDHRPPRSGIPPWSTFVLGDLSRQGAYVRLAEAMRDAAPPGAPLFYLATVPRLFPEIVRRLQNEGLARPGSRIAVEKPFGVDLKSSRLLESRLGSAFAKKRIFRVDHFLCKDGTIGMAHFRFVDGRFERIWNRGFVDSVQIMADEDSAIGGRGGFYDSVGVVRDMVQNHLLQLLCLVSMDPPDSDEPRSRERAKTKLLKSIAPISRQDVVLGQYRGYERATGVRRGSRTPTFVALRLLIRSERWDGVPFYLRSGRPLARDATEVVVTFKGGAEGPKGSRLPRAIRFSIDPVARTTVDWGGPELVWKDRSLMRVHEDEYRRVIQGVLSGDQGLFAGSRFNELSWKLFDPIVQSQGDPDRYDAGGWGPASSDLLLARDGRSWLDDRSRRVA